MVQTQLCNILFINYIKHFQ